MQMPNLPEQINRSALTAALESLGIPVAYQRLRSLLIEADKATLTYVRTDDAGLAHRAGTDIATVTVTVHISDDAD